MAQEEVKIGVEGDSSGFVSSVERAKAATDKFWSDFKRELEESGKDTSDFANQFALANVSAAEEAASRQRYAAEASRQTAAQYAAEARAAQTASAQAQVAAAKAAAEVQRLAQAEAAARQGADDVAARAAETSSAKIAAAAERSATAASAAAKAEAAAKEAVAAASAARADGESAQKIRRAEAEAARLTEAAKKSAQAAAAAAQAEAAARQAAATAAASAKAEAEARATAAAERHTQARAALAQAEARAVEAAARQAAAAQASTQAQATATHAAEAAKRAASEAQSMRRMQEQAIQSAGGTRALEAYRAAQAGVAEQSQVMRDAVHGVAGAQRQAAMTAGQLAQANRMLPMQMGDVAVSLASGMPPLMVLMQQGFQIRDMYGSVGAALRATAGYVAGLANPITLTAVAVAGMAAIAYDAASADKSLRDSLILTGNSAGLTGTQVTAMSASVASAANVTSAAAAGGMEAMIRSGRVGAESLALATEAALELERAGGPAVEETAKSFASLGADPLNAALKLNESFNFLTESTYEQIKAALELGDKHKAAEIAQTAYAEAAKKAAEEVLANRGPMLKMWDDLTAGAYKYASALFQVGAAAKTELGGLREKAALGELTDQELDRWQILENQAKEKEKAAKAQADENKLIQARAAWDKSMGNSMSQYLPKVERQKALESQIAKIRTQGAAAQAPQFEIDAQIKAAEAAAAAVDKKAASPSPKKKKQESQTQEYEAQLSELKASLAQQNAENNTFRQFEKSEELKFWEEKLATVAKGSKDEVSIRKKIADLRVSINKESFDAELEGFRAQIAEVGKNAAARVAIEEQALERITAAYGAGSREAIKAGAAVAAAKIAAEEQAGQLAAIAASRADGLAISAIESERMAYEQAVQLGLAAQENKIAAEIAFQDRIYEIKRAALERERALIPPDRDPVAYQQVITKITELETAHSASSMQMAQRQRAQGLDGWKSFADGAGAALGESIAGLATGEASIKGLFSSILQTGLQIPGKIASEWLSAEIMKRVAMTGTAALQQTQAVTTAGVQQAAAVTTAGTQISAAAGVAGANALASNAAAPWPLGLGAPAIAAGMVAAVLGFKALASAEGGWLDTGSGNPLTQLHAREMVLPRTVADPMRGAIGAMHAMPAVAAALPALQSMSQPMSMPRLGLASDVVARQQSAPAQQRQQTGQPTQYNITMQATGFGDRGLGKALAKQGGAIKSQISKLHRQRIK
jgi:hypothetical protein